MDFRFRVAKAFALLSPLFLIGILISFQIRSEAQERTRRLNFVPISGAAALTKGLPEDSQIALPSIARSFSLAKSLTVTNWPNIPVIAMQRPQNETSIVVSPGDPLNFVGVWNDYQQTVGNNVKNVHAGYGYSSNGGASWQRGLITSPYQSQFDPSVTSDKNGNFYYCFAAQDTGQWVDLPGGIFVAKANASSKGATWGTPVVVVQHPSFPAPYFEDKPYVSVDITNLSYAGNIYVVWTRFSAAELDTSRILFTKSTNGGTSFSQNFVQLDMEYYKHPEVGPFDYVQGAVPTVGPNGEIYVAWTKFDPERPDEMTKNFIRFNKSTTGGSSFGNLVNVAGIRAVRGIKENLEAPSFPSMAVDVNNGYIYIVWHAKSNSGDLDIYLSKSTNGGTSWTASPIRVNQDPSGNGKDQFLPWISVDPTGRISIIYYDQRNYPSTDPWVDLYLAESLDFANSFLEYQVNDTSINVEDYWIPGDKFIGDYLGVASNVGYIYPLWTDTRRGTEDIFTARVNRPPTSNSATATASNSQRKLARDNNGTYHLVFETNQEIWYGRKASTDTECNNYQRLSSGMAGGNSSPCIAERSGNIYVVWQQLSGSSYSVYFHKSTDGGTTWPTGNRQTLSSSLGSNPPLPVITSPAAQTLTAVYRTSLNLRYKVSNNNGSNWTSGTVPSTGTNDNSPTLAPTTTHWGSARSALVYANTSSVIYYRYYKNGPDSTGWNASAKNLSQIVPGSYSNHQRPSIAPSGTSGDKRLHVAWEATQVSSGWRVIIHRKATDWGTWPNVYSTTYYQEQQLPNITGLHDDTAELLFPMVSQNQIYKMHYDGSTWGAPVFVAEGTNPSVSVGNTTAKYVWTYGTASPYQIKISTETLSKVTTGPLAVAYHRSTAVIDTTAGAWLDVRIDKISVKTKTGKELVIPFSTAQEDPLTLTPTKAFGNLSSLPVVLPADAESLLVSYWTSGNNLSAIKNASNPLRVEFVVTNRSANTIGFAALSTTAETLPETKFLLSTPISAFAGEEITVQTQVTGPASKSSLLASLGHLYEIVQGGAPEILSKDTENTIPHDFALAIYPNPFNPSTHIEFTLAAEDIVTLRVYNLQGQLVRELLHGYRPAGHHIIPWDGRDDRGLAAASGLYFMRLQTSMETKINKLTLVR